MEISIQTGDIVNELGFEQGFKAIAAAGFTAVDWNIDKIWNTRDLYHGIVPKKTLLNEAPEKIRAAFDGQLNTMKACGLHPTQAHAPFPAYIKGHPEFTELCIEIYKNALRLCKYAGCPRLVIHGISHAMDDDTVTDAELHELNMHMYSSLIPTIKETGVTVLLENLFVSYRGCTYQGTCSDPNEAVEYVDSLNALAGSECFGFCLDVGHLNLLGIKQHTFIEKLGRRIKALHIHDNAGNADSHLMPYVGTVDWDDFCDALNRIGYEGDLSFETFQQTSMKRINPTLLPAFLTLIHTTGEYFKGRISE